MVVTDLLHFYNILSNSFQFKTRNTPLEPLFTDRTNSQEFDFVFQDCALVRRKFKKKKKFRSRKTIIPYTEINISLTVYCFSVRYKYRSHTRVILFCIRVGFWGRTHGVFLFFLKTLYLVTANTVNRFW